MLLKVGTINAKRVYLAYYITDSLYITVYFQLTTQTIGIHVPRDGVKTGNNTG